jgi:hypothetical protein
MAAFRVNGGVITDQTLAGSLRFFKMAGPFHWTKSDGSVNLPVLVHGGKVAADSYFVVGEDKPVPNSAAELALQEISKQCSIVIIAPQGAAGAETAIHFACSASAFGWGSDTPGYSAAAAALDEDPTAAAPAMQVAVRALGNKTVYVSVGAADQAHVPVTAVADLNTVTITEVAFALA